MCSSHFITQNILEHRLLVTHVLKGLGLITRILLSLSRILLSETGKFFIQVHGGKN